MAAQFHTLNMVQYITVGHIQLMDIIVYVDAEQPLATVV